MAWPAELAEWSDAAHAIVVRRVWNELTRTVHSAPALAEVVNEAVQDAFIAAMNLIGEPGRFQSRDHFVFWLCKVARNRAISTLRREKKYVPLHEARKPLMHSSDAAEDLVWKKALATLSRDERRWLYCYYVLEWSDAEIAAMQKVSMTKLHRARHTVLRRLREILMSERRDPDEWDIPENILQTVASDCADLLSPAASSETSASNMT